MTISDNETGQESAALPKGDPAFLDILPAWQQVFDAWSIHLRKSTDLVAAELTLSVKAIMISLVCVLLLVGIVLIIWSTLLGAVFYGLSSAGLHWAFCVTLVLTLNIAAYFFVKAQLTDAANAINMKGTVKRIFGSQKSTAEC